MPHLGARALFASALVLAWACAEQTGSDLGGGGDSPSAGKGGGKTGGTGGTTVAMGGSGGSSAASTGGSSASAGKGGTGTGGSSTGGSSTGGSATGGDGNASATGGSSTGGSSNGGQGGDDTIPPEVLENADVVLRYIARGHDDRANAIDTQLFLENKSDDALPLAQTKIRYWATLDGASFGNLMCYHTGNLIGAKSNVLLSVVEDDDDTHVLIEFSTGEIPAHNASPFKDTEFQMKLDAQGGTMFDQTNDWSFDDSLTNQDIPQPNGKITVYLADKLVWGCEPSRKCAGDDGEGGAGGQAGQAGQTGTGGTGQGGSVTGGQGGEPSSGQGGA